MALLPIYSNIDSNIVIRKGAVITIMFIFKQKTIHEGIYEASIVYQWDIVLEDSVIGHIILDISPPTVEQSYWLDYSINMPDIIRPIITPAKANARAVIYNTVDYGSHIIQLILDFKHLANNKLLDIDEEYGKVDFIVVSHGDDWRSDVIC